MRKMYFTIGLMTIFATAVADGAMKLFTIENFSDGHSIHLLPFVDFILHRNPGITGDIPVPMWIITPITLYVILFLIDRISLHYRERKIITLSMIAIIAGAMNNFIDRIMNGFTTDYLMFFHTSIINFSDVLIFGGVMIILLYNKNNPHTLCTIIPKPPPTKQYGVVSRLLRSIVRTIRNSSHR